MKEIVKITPAHIIKFLEEEKDIEKLEDNRLYIENPNFDFYKIIIDYQKDIKN